MAYQSSGMGRLAPRCLGRRSVADLPRDEEEEEHAEDEIEPAEAQQREERRAAVDRGARALRRPEEAVDEPWLPSQLRRDPSRDDGDVRKRESEHENPEHWTGLLQAAHPAQNVRRHHDRDQDRPEARHDVEGVIEKLDAVSYTHLRAHETRHDLVCRLLL